jgi:hypothetical protein
MKTRREFVGSAAAAFGGLALRTVPFVGGGAALLCPRRAEAATVLDPQNPTVNFKKEGNEVFRPGAVLTLTDATNADFVALFATDLDAAAGVEIDVVTAFQVKLTLPNNADAGNRIVINDGLTRSAIAACIVLNGVRGIGLLSTGSPSDPAAYPVFVPVDWTAPVTLRLRRTATGDAEIIEVNGVTPAPRAFLAAAQCPAPTRGGATVEFGCRSVEAQCTVEYAAFRSERVVPPVAGTVNLTSCSLRDTVDRIRFRGDYVLGAGGNGIDPSTEPVAIRLSTPGLGVFYPVPDFNPLAGFTVQGAPGKRRWTLTDAERARSGIEQLVLDEGGNNTGSISLRDFRAALPDANFSTVNVEIIIGTGVTADRLTGTASLVEKPAGSGRWSL